METADQLPDLDFDLDALSEFDLDIDIDGFDLDLAAPTTAVATTLAVIPRYPRPRPHLVRYERAVDFVSSLPDLHQGQTVHALVSGNFIFGDALEALLVERNYYAEEMMIATLSLGKENVDSLYNLQQGDYLGYLALIVSDYWYSHERRRAGGVPYIEQTLCAGAEKFDLAAAGLHTKITLIRTSCGKHLVCHGSANLRSSRNLEQLTIDNNPELYHFHAAWMRHLVAHFRATNHSLRGDQLWQALPEPAAKANSPTGEPKPPPPASANPSENK